MKLTKEQWEQIISILLGTALAGTLTVNAVTNNGVADTGGNGR